jgi:hypothetical protein
MNQRFVPLSFTVGAGSLRVAAPSNGNEAPPGYYLLFVVDGDGVPSDARLIKLYGRKGGGSSCGNGAFLAVMAVTTLVIGLELRSRRA